MPGKVERWGGWGNGGHQGKSNGFEGGMSHLACYAQS